MQNPSGSRRRVLFAGLLLAGVCTSTAPEAARAATPEVILRSIEDVDALRALLDDPESFRLLLASSERLALREIVTRGVTDLTERCDEGSTVREHVFRFAPEEAQTGRRLERRFVSCRSASGEWSFHSIDSRVARLEATEPDSLPPRAAWQRSAARTPELLRVLREALANSTLAAELQRVFDRSGEVASLRLRQQPTREVEGEETRRAELQIEWRTVVGADEDGKPSFITRWAYHAIEFEPDVGSIRSLVPDEANEI